MKKAIKDYWRPFVALLGIGLVSLLVGGFILANQRLYLPKWVPLVGSNFVDYKADLQTAQAITPGQGQTVDVAGVPVGEIAKVQLKDGRAVVTMKIRKRYTPIYKDASILVRPKTGLDDIVLELTPGTRQAGVLPVKGSIPVSQTLPDVNLDEILSSLDGDTRDYLQLLIGGAGDGLKGNGANLEAAFKRFAPTATETEKLTGLLSKRQVNIKRTIHNFSLLSQALADKDTQLSQLVVSSNKVFKDFADQDANVQKTLRDLPPALQATKTGLGKADTLARAAGPALGRLRPGARALGPALRQTRPLFTKVTPVIKNQLRPFSRDALPTVVQLRPAARDLAVATPALTDTLKVANYAFNELAYDKPGDGNQSFLFYFNWANHLGATLFATQDAHGPIRRGIVQISCGSLGVLDQLTKANPQLGLLTVLLGAPTTSQVCPTNAGAGASGTTGLPGGGVGGTGIQLPLVGNPIPDAGGVSALSPDAPKTRELVKGGK